MPSDRKPPAPAFSSTPIGLRQLAILSAWIIGALLLLMMLAARADNANTQDFGSCRQIATATGPVQSCTYRDGHTELLDLSDATAR